jgi:hypothetical protein
VKTLLIMMSGVAMAASIGNVHADDLPVVKDGLWLTHTSQTIDGKTMNVGVKTCQSADNQKKEHELSAQLREKNKCTGSVTQPSPGVYVSQSNCTGGAGGPTTSKTTITFQGTDAYKLEMHMDIGKKETVMTADSKFLGSCPVGMKPGDTVMENPPK